MDATASAAPSMRPEWRNVGRGQLRPVWRARTGGLSVVEAWLEDQREQLPLWLPVAVGTGIAAWFTIPGPNGWAAFLCLCGASALAALLLPAGTRARRLVMFAGLAGALGLSVAWFRATTVAAPVLDRPHVVSFTGVVERVEAQPARDRMRVTLAPDATAQLPPRVRVSIASADAPVDAKPGDRLSLRARLVPPPGASVPGGYDFARAAWFMRLGAIGKAIGPVTRTPGTPADMRGVGDAGLRARLSAHVRSRIAGSAGGIAAAFASGDRGGIAIEDEEAMRGSGLTHLLSISGLHVTAVVGAAMLFTLKLLALSPRLALRVPLVVVAAGSGAAAGIGYTLLTGAEVPTVRSCIAALLIVVGVAIGRRAFTLRLVAVGALVIMLLWPEALIGPSFQLSFAAIASIVAMHEWPPLARLVAPHDEHPGLRLLRQIGGLLLTGVVIEVALAPIALYHFHRQGLYGALANIVAIPLTTFVTMPAEAMALLLDTVGLGRPFWWLTGQSLDLLLWIARRVAALPGAVATLPEVPLPALAAMVFGGLWLMLWRGRVRGLGLLPVALGAVLTATTPAPDLLVTSDGMHMAVRSDSGRLATLRPRAGDYVRGVMAERSGDLDTLEDLDLVDGASCNRDLCRIDLIRDDRRWRIVATRSRYRLDLATFARECEGADIVVSDRVLPRSCRPKWLKADRPFLDRSGGLAITLDPLRAVTVADGRGHHPWVATAINTGGAGRRASPARAPDWRRRTAPDRRRSRDQDEREDRRSESI